ncbi:hypothetical protein HanXRQr2_Chr12g0539721 [Helianthus annuus]|uniref:Uncharacterized protein n=1 Tax=Helianthus annuus TaxID=4232 RepID=A0A9K3HG98_HELAN|nr:hypothetical protein HanXRQr2_Chr12g0539721 [Helianthus annuus]KAJ0862550.1 hypothetical protein HanPSC8_Chr12g0519501 [Helianthus annuus]
MFQERIIAQIVQSEPITNKNCGGRGSDPLVTAPLSSLSPSFSLFTFSLYLGKKTPNNKTPLQHGDNSGGDPFPPSPLPFPSIFSFSLLLRVFKGQKAEATCLKGRMTT